MSPFPSGRVVSQRTLPSVSVNSTAQHKKRELRSAEPQATEADKAEADSPPTPMVLDCDLGLPESLGDLGLASFVS